MLKYVYAKICLSKPAITDWNWQKSTTIPNAKFIITIEFAKIVKSVPFFELSNLFLVWVAQKVMALSNLNLLLIEYYEERLKPQPKKKETYITNYISIEL